MTVVAPPAVPTIDVADAPTRAPVGTIALLGLGGLFAGVTGPLLSTFVPPLVGDALGDQRTAIGVVMAIDNLLLLALVPWAGPFSDRVRATGGRRLTLVLLGFVLASLGMAALPSAATFGLPFLIGALVVLHAGINVQRSPFHALLADAVPSRWRSLATGSMTFQMCVAAIGFLVLGRTLGMRPAFLIAAAAVLAIAVMLGFGIREPRTTSASAEVTFRSLVDVAWAAISGGVRAMRPIFLATLLLQLTFQSFTTWYALHATAHFGVTPEDVTIGFIAWALGGVLGALPAGFVGVRIGRRNAMLAGFAAMAICLLALDRVTAMSQAVPLLALASASWTFPMVNAFPLFVEPVPREHRGALASMFLLCMALGGAIGDPLNGRIFDLLDGYRALFLLMAAYAVLAFAAVLLVPRGAGERESASTTV